MAKEKISPTQRALNLWAIVLIIWAVYRSKFNFFPPEIDEFIAKPLVFILPVWYYIKHYENGKFFDRLDLHRKTLKTDIVYGLGIGAIFFGSAVLAQLVGKGKVIFLQGKSFSPETVGLMVVMAIATAISEEILSRGFILKRLYEESKNVWSASFLASILFFFLHVPILFGDPKINGNMLLIFLVTDMILSLTNSFIFLWRKSLVLPILIHALYSLAIIFFL